MNSSTMHVLSLLFPLVVGYLTRAIMEGLKNAIAAIDNFPAWAKQVTVVLISVLLSALGAWAGVDLGTTLGGVTDAGITALLSAIFAMVTHNGAKLAHFQRNGAVKPSNAGKHYGLAILFLFAYAASVTLVACQQATP